MFTISIPFYIVIAVYVFSVSSYYILVTDQPIHDYSTSSLTIQHANAYTSVSLVFRQLTRYIRCCRNSCMLYVLLSVTDRHISTAEEWVVHAVKTESHYKLFFVRPFSVHCVTTDHVSYRPYAPCVKEKHK